MTDLRVVFMGTPPLAARALEGLYQAGYTLPLVLTRPDSPAGRGRQPAAPPVKTLALEMGSEVLQPASLKTPAVLERIRSAAPDVIVVAAYGLMLPPAVLTAAPAGCLNIHASLLPAYRGAAPIQWALLRGETETGVTVMQMDQGLDTGPILMQEKLPVPTDMDYGGLYGALADLGSRLLLEALPLWLAGRLTPRAQPAEGGFYACMLDRRHEAIDWTRPACQIRNQVRAFSPAPGASARLGGKELKILRAEVLDGPLAEGFLRTAGAESDASPGRYLGALRRRGPVVATGEGLLLLSEVLPAGKKPMTGLAWLNGSRLEPGLCFD